MKHMILKTNLTALMAVFSLPAWADSRIRTEIYNPERVYPIYTEVGKAALVQLEADERLDGEAAALGMGDADAWAVAVRGNNIIFKPKAEKPLTNMIVVSNKRTYAFDLKFESKLNPPTYIMKFSYPDTVQKQQAALNAKQDQAFQALRETGALHNAEMHHNTEYYGQGSKNIAPTNIYDNGRFTFMTFNNGRDMPTVYRVEADGTETLLNTHLENATLVIHEVNEKLMLRLGRLVLLIENRGFQPAGTFNHTGTDNNETVRLIK